MSFKTTDIMLPSFANACPTSELNGMKNVPPQEWKLKL